MWTISQIKENGKANFKKNYWYCVLVTIILGICTGGSSGYAGRNTSSAAAQNGENLFNNLDPALIAAIFGIVSTAILIGLVVDILLLNPLEVGCQKFFIYNRTDEKTQLNALGEPFKRNWMNTVLTLFVRDIFTVLWFMLFIIPGIIKCYSYRLVPYIVAENPDIQPMEAISLSRSMMNGNKWKAFVFDLSYIGWYILTILTVGVLGVFYVLPYKNCANAELYTAVKENYNPSTM